MKFLPAPAIVFFLALDKDWGVSFVSAESSVPSEAPTREYSDYPVYRSSFPSALYPESDKPFYEATCVEDHKNVVDTLYDTFGRGNCVKNNPIPYVQTVKCEAFGTVLSGTGKSKKISAEYMGAYGAPYAFSENCLVDYVPSALTLTSTYLDGSSSLQEQLFFSRKDCGGCLADMKTFLDSIRYDRRWGRNCEDDLLWRYRGNFQKDCNNWLTNKNDAKANEICNKRANKLKSDKSKVSKYCFRTCANVSISLGTVAEDLPIACQA